MTRVYARRDRADLRTAERVAVRCGRAADRAAMAASVIGKTGRTLVWPVVMVLTAAEQAAFGVDDLLQRRRA